MQPLKKVLFLKNSTPWLIFNNRFKLLEPLNAGFFLTDIKFHHQGLKVYIVEERKILYTDQNRSKRD